MEDKSDRMDRKLRQCYQCNRFEKHLWVMAYEQLLPERHNDWIANAEELDLNRTFVPYAKGA